MLWSINRDGSLPIKVYFVSLFWEDGFCQLRKLHRLSLQVVIYSFLEPDITPKAALFENYDTRVSGLVR